jgi:CubicO group peptidase (beta-lactamase class C family)
MQAPFSAISTWPVAQPDGAAAASSRANGSMPRSDPRSPASDGLDYGYLWFFGEATMPALPGPRRWSGGFGNGGQRLWPMPDAGLAVAILSGRYNTPDSWITPMRIWLEIVLANLQRA